MTTRPKGTSLVMTMMTMTNIVGQAEYTNLVMMMSLRRTNNVGQARRHQPGENDDDDNAHGARRQSLVPSFNLALFVAKFVAQGDCIPYTLAIQPNEPYSLAMPLLIDTLVFEINP